MKTEQPIPTPISAALVVPDMVHPYGKHWKQPLREAITINDANAFMDRATFDQLADYSYSQPSGVYEGKMWKASNAYYHKTENGEPLRWWLHWFGPGDHPDYCSDHVREIVIHP